MPRVVGWNSISILSILVALNVLLPVDSLSAQGSLQSNRDDRKPSVEKTIKLSDLPKPPKALEQLISRGAVQFVTGGVPKSDSDGFPRLSKLAGETRFNFRYRYQTRIRWFVSGSMVDLRVQFTNIKLIQTHDIWLRKPPSSDAFWDDRVVKHEFDHVRISSDPRIEELFYSEVRKLSSMRIPTANVIGIVGAVDEAKINELIEREVGEAMNRTADMVRIRYQELDRLTQHGLRPIPADANLGFSMKSP